MLEISNKVKEIYPDSKFGVLIMKDVKNPVKCEEFNKMKNQVIDYLRNANKDYNRKDFSRTEPICNYITYYKKYKKTYHVLLQLESIVLKGKTIPSIAALVEAMFTAEVKNLLLTAGHDLDKLSLPLKIDVATSNESYVGMNGKEINVYENDIFLADNESIISSIINGPDSRTKITSDTKNALFFIYAPQGISSDAVINHLNDIKSYVSIIAPESKTQLIKVFEISN